MLHDEYNCRLFEIRDSKGHAMLVSPNRPVYDYENDAVIFPKYLGLHLAVSETDFGNGKSFPLPNCAVGHDGFVYAIRRIEPHTELILSNENKTVETYPLESQGANDVGSAPRRPRSSVKRKTGGDSVPTKERCPTEKAYKRR